MNEHVEAYATTAFIYLAVAAALTWFAVAPSIGSSHLDSLPIADLSSHGAYTILAHHAHGGVDIVGHGDLIQCVNLTNAAFDLRRLDGTDVTIQCVRN